MDELSLTDSLEETLAVFNSDEPRTTTEVAETLELGRRSTYARLERLVEKDRLKTKKVGASARVWWRPSIATADQEMRTDHPNHAEFAPLVEAVEEYAIFTLDPEGRVRSWNPGARRIKGFEAEDILGEHFSIFYTEEDRAASIPEENLARAVDEGSIKDEGWRSRADGSQFWADVTISAIRDDEGTLLGFAKVTKDTTARYERENTLQQQRDFIEGVLETTPVGVLTVEPDGSFAVANERATELLGLDTESDEVGVKAVYDEDGEFIPPSDRPYVTAFETGESIRNWHAQIDIDGGGRRWLSSNIEPMMEEGEVKRVLVTIEDVTKLKTQADRLARQRDDLRSELEEFFTRVDDAFIAMDRNWRITYVNDRAAELVRLPPGELVGARVWDVLYEVAEGNPREQAERAMKTQESVEFEFYSEVLDIWVEVRGYPSETGMSVYFRDVTERKERENELERYETTIETVWDGVTTLDAEHRFVMVNEAFCEMSGYDREELIGEHATLILDEATFEDALRIQQEVEAGERNIGLLEYDLQTAGGGSIPVEARFGPIEFEDGSTGGTGVIRDISERKAREAELRNTKSKLEAAIRAGRVGTFEWNIVEDRFQTGEWLAERFAVSPDAAREGISLEELMAAVHEADRQRVLAAIQQAVDSGSKYEEEYRVRNAEGEVRWVIARGRVHTDESGTPITFPGAIIDVTGQKRAELALERQRNRLSALDSLNQAVRGLTEAVIEQSTREEIERTVCEHLAESESYLYAWIGEIDSTADRVSVRTARGLEDLAEPSTLGTADEIVSDLDAVIRENKIHRISGEIGLSEGEFTHDHHVETSVAVPIAHEEGAYGVLVVSSQRSDAFSEREGQLMAHLGEIIGHAIGAAERKQALVSDELVELEFRIADVLGDYLAGSEPAGRIDIDHTIMIAEDEFLIYGTVSADGVDTLTEFAESIPEWNDLVIRSEGDPASFEVRVTHPPVLSSFADIGGYVDAATIEQGNLDAVVHLAPSVDVRHLVEIIEDEYPDADILRRRQIARPPDEFIPIQRRLEDELTTRQRIVLDAAFHSGYFEWPRDTSGEEVAASLDIAPATFSQHLRKAEKTVFESLLS